MVFLRDITIFGPEIGCLYNNPRSNLLHRSLGNPIHILDLGRRWAALGNGSRSRQ